MMSISVTFSSSHRVLLASDFFMARRPIVDRHKQLAAYELLFCQAHEQADAAVALDGEQPANASVLEDVCQHGLGRILGDTIGVLYIDAQALMSDIFHFLPAKQIILELAPGPKVTPALIERISALHQQGFRFALAIDADADAGESPQLLPYIDGIRIDVTFRKREELSHFSSMFKTHGKMLLAERVDTMDQYQECLELGFDYFQGYHFAEPHILEGKKLSPSQLAVIDLMAMLASDADDSVIEHAIKGDVTLGLNLLRLVNTPAISTHRIESLRQALIAIGRNQLQRWLHIMLYAERDASGKAVIPLMMQATTRGRLMELVAQRMRPGNRGLADTAFTVGIMSLMDSLFSMPMADIVQQIPVIDEVADALLQREGYFGKLLRLAEQTEWHEGTGSKLAQSLAELNLSCKDLYLLQLSAFEWSDQVTRGMH
ncbi:EAL and HDOD domain-containing protein [Noviherbaspirillum saxi]|uniref:EAL domain-containing protein n=1 Tax=Noviherbaspirillum saxi TaxID=2320863 RepID=A0A3A3FLN3_9BURK|nr:EAL domain-containing protein [Noviherbaspirillum saxi]RJF96217.1 EAL domain-containing protein [Noviherbaspirillum saxi]